MTKGGKTVAEIDIKFACGCGFVGHVKAETKTSRPTDDTIEQLIPITDHVEKTGHSVSSIVGTIRPSK